jgi:hypothetical protein
MIFNILLLFKNANNSCHSKYEGSAYNFAFKDLHWLCLHEGNLSPSDCLHFQVPNQTFSGNRFRDDGEMETVELPWLVTQDTDFCYHGMVWLLPLYDKRPSCGGVYAKPRTAVQLNLSVSCWS